MDYQNFKNRQTTNLAVFGWFLDGFWVVFGRFWAIFGDFGGYIVLFITSIILKIFTHQTSQFKKRGLSKFQKPPNRQPGGFWAVLAVLVPI